MGQPRLSIAGLLGLVALAALWLASLRFASVWWTTAASTVTLAILLYGVVGAFLLSGKDRAFWAGFSLFGWVYLLLVNWDWVGGQFGHDLTGGLADLAEQIIAQPAVPSVIPQTTPNAPTALPSMMVPNAVFIAESLQRAIKVGNFVQIGRMSLDLLFALLGGFLSRWLAARQREGRREP